MLLRSFSKVSFPGLRVGWALGPKPLIDRLRQAKEAADLHTDQLSQAVLLEFAESGRLEAHRARVLRGRRRAARGDARCLPRIPAAGHALDAARRRHERVGAAARAAGCRRAAGARAEEGVVLPGRYFAVSRLEPGALRLSFAGLTPEQIRTGLAILGQSRRGGDGERRAEFRACAGDGLKTNRVRCQRSEHVSVFERAFRLKVGLAEMLKGGVIMDVTNAEQAKIAEDAGASAVMALERVPSDIRKEGGVARMANIAQDRGDHEDRHHSGDGQGAHRPLHGSAGPGSAGRGLHRRERSADARRRRAPHRQERVQGAVRLRRAQSGRGAAAHRRRRRHDPHQGRGGLAATSWKRCGTSAPSSRR